MTETQEHRELRLQVEREYGVGIDPARNGMAAASRDEMETAAAAIARKQNRRAGYKALVNKYGEARAKRIIGTRR